MSEGEGGWNLTTIERAVNGWIVRITDGEQPDVSVFDDERGEAQAFAAMLRFLADQFMPGSRHDAERVYVEVRPGDKYFDPSVGSQARRREGADRQHDQEVSVAVTERGQRILDYVAKELDAPEPDRRERIRQALARWMERNATGKVRRYRPNSIKSRKRD